MPSTPTRRANCPPPASNLFLPFQGGASVVVYSNCQCSSGFCWSLAYCLFSWDSSVAICSEIAVPLAFHFCCFYFSAILVIRVPFPFGVWGRVSNSVVSVPDHCLFYLLLDLTRIAFKKLVTAL